MGSPESAAVALERRLVRLESQIGQVEEHIDTGLRELTMSVRELSDHVARTNGRVIELERAQIRLQAQKEVLVRLGSAGAVLLTLLGPVVGVLAARYVG